ncbi:hypothetical protein [Heyndrickxia camelliae]|uniref:Uncharacterized protein n=1 Tax=Heyndrickxia camelliae TaxID=1707093 RepID=A0A2N3LG95_9BACI|nr:hypothetical protein [Heyndrickxia camelliae]PKR83648.1 hypothetical protein CWO92_17830 [Heyndrickxia camelliae]
MPFEPPAEHYDEHIEVIDEQICNLIRKRKELSKNNPGFPTKQLICDWSIKYNFYEDFLNSVFAHFLNEEIYKPVVEPKGFLKNIPILKSFEIDDWFYSVTFVRQFQNASVVHLNLDRDDSDEMPGVFPEHYWFDLSIDDDDGEGINYDCRNEGGGGSRGHSSYTFVVSPPLPDDVSKIKLVFKEYKTPLKTKPTGLEFVIRMDN